jgi:hypothetical protein
MGAANVWVEQPTTELLEYSEGQALAGIADLGSLRQFVQRYGPMSNRPGESEYVNPIFFAFELFVLRWAWRGDEDAVALIAGEKTSPRSLVEFFGKKGLPIPQEWIHDNEDLELNHRIRAQLVGRASGVDIVTDNLWDFVRLGFLRDHQMGLTAICANEHCVTPFFVQRGSRRRYYCSHDCAMAAASRNYRGRVKQLVEKEKAAGRWPGRQK